MTNVLSRAVTVRADVIGNSLTYFQKQAAFYTCTRSHQRPSSSCWAPGVCFLSSSLTGHGFQVNKPLFVHTFRAKNGKTKDVVHMLFPFNSGYAGFDLRGQGAGMGCFWSLPQILKQPNCFVIVGKRLLRSANPFTCTHLCGRICREAVRRVPSFGA